jgi:predicted transcriptional regulator
VWEVGLRNLVLSIHPEYAHAILSGAKTVELRRRIPVDTKQGSTLYIYATSPTKALIGQATIESSFSAPLNELWDSYGPQSYVSKKKFFEYFTGCDIGSAFQLKNPSTFKKLLSLDSLKSEIDFVAPQSFLYATEQFEKLVSQVADENTSGRKCPDRAGRSRRNKGESGTASRTLERA